MTHFFIDLWHDLREKRLWPVAVGLVAAIAAIPAVLFKPAGGTPAPSAPVASAAPSVGSTLPLVSVSDLPTQGSKLETFSQKNPFQPMKDLDKTQVASAAKPASSPSTGAAPSSAGHLGGGGGSTTLTGGTSVPSGGGSTGGSQTSSHTTTSSWTYTASFKFGTPDKMKTIKDANPFSPLPDESAPVLLFASADASHAVFYLQDSSFQPQGEGKCDTQDKCRFVTLTLKDTGDEEAFVSADGTQEYDVQLLSIKKKSLDAAAKGASKGHGKAVKGAGAHASVATEAILPVLLGFTAATTTTRHK